VPPSQMAGVFMTLGDKETALDWLERSYEERSNYMAYIAVDPGNVPLHADPRFQSLLTRTGQSLALIGENRRAGAR
jgi:hypothetical protein